MKTKYQIVSLLLVAAMLGGCGGAAVQVAPEVPGQSGPAESQPPRPIATSAPEATRAVSAQEPAQIAESPREDKGSRPPAQTAAAEEYREPRITATPPINNTYQDYGVNPPVDTRRDHLSTFALDVDTASYALARRYITDGNLPPMEAVRAEEFVNYFEQGYPRPNNVAFGIYADGAPSPFHRDGSTLLRIGVQGYDVPARERKPAALTFIIDVSGSMRTGGRLEMVKDALRLLVNRLNRADSVAIAVFTTNAWVALQPTSGADKRAILQAIDSLSPQNSTNVDEGLQVGYGLADEMYRDGYNNRVMLCSDGVANTGSTNPDALVELVSGYARRGIMLTTVGVGMGNYNDVLLERLANQSNGMYTYIDTPDEARKLFVEKLTGTLQTIAIDAKVQVDFNSEVVESYRLIGYENRAIADRDFRNDAVDAGEIGAGHTATALYAVQLRPRAEGRIATVQLRWQDPDTRAVQEINGNVNTFDLSARYDQTAPRFQLAATVAQFAEILRRSPYAGETSLWELSRYAEDAARLVGEDADAQEFAELVSHAAQIGE
jgi:Ca-activated chloride channel family protein